jgi:lysine-N-methylase
MEQRGFPDDCLLQPRYAESFRCLGGDCEDTCCKGWGILIDKATYKKYRATPALRPLVSRHMKLEPHSSNNFKHARIKFKADGTCPFLTPEQWCGIQKEYGSGFLSTVCARYPRAFNQFDGSPQTALYLSCPEAARQVLLSPQLLPDPGPTRYREFISTDPGLAWLVNSEPPARQLRRFALQLLTDRSYPLWQRLFLLGTVCRRVHEFGSSQLAQVPQLLRHYAEIIVQGSLCPELNCIPVRPEQQLDMALGLIRRRFELEQPKDGFAHSVAEFLQTINYSPERPLHEPAARYQQGFAQHYQLFAKLYPNFLENYLINYAFRTRFPFADTVDKEEPEIEPNCSYALMAIHYRLLHSLLIGAAARMGEAFSADDAIQVTKAFSKEIEHNPVFLDGLKASIRSGQAFDTDTLAILLRN